MLGNKKLEFKPECLGWSCHYATWCFAAFLGDIFILKWGWIMKKIFCCPALELFHCLPSLSCGQQWGYMEKSYKCCKMQQILYPINVEMEMNTNLKLLGQVDLLGTNIFKTQMVLIFLDWQKSPRNLWIFFLTRSLTIFEGSLNLDTLATFQIRFNKESTFNLVYKNSWKLQELFDISEALQTCNKVIGRYATHT